MGMTLLGVWLVFTGLMAFIPMGSPVGPAMAILAIVAGILILVGGR